MHKRGGKQTLLNRFFKILLQHTARFCAGVGLHSKGTCLHTDERTNSA